MRGRARREAHARKCPAREFCLPNELPCAPGFNLCGVRALRILRLLLLSCLCAAATNLAHAQTSDAWAILVGVSEYTDLKGLRPLRGPGNDVAMMRDTLLRVRAGWREVEVLADGADRADGIPTRDAIVSTLERIGNTARPNDILVFHFSGYGSHQPAGNGLEEILLPKDAGKWDASVGKVKNTISRSELHALLAPVAAKGVRVWIILDTAFSSAASGGSMYAGYEGTRWARPVELGIPPSSGSVVNSDAGALDSRSSAGGTTAGELVTFVAAQPDETTPELRFPQADPKGVYQGLFTWSLANAMLASGPATYDQLAQQVMVRYAALNRLSPTPRFEGPLDHGVPALGTRRAIAGHVDLRRTHIRARVSGLRLCDSALAVTPCAGESSNADDRTMRDRVEKMILTPSKRGVLPIDLLSDPQDADLILFMHQGRVSFVSPMDDYDRFERTPAYFESAEAEKDADLEKQLSARIQSIAVTSWLYRLGETQQQPHGLTWRMTRCGPTPAPFNLLAPPEILPVGQPLCVEFQNSGKDPMDVTLLRVSENYDIDALFPTEKIPNRIAPGARQVINLEVGPVDVPALERLIALAAPARKDSRPMDFRWATNPSGRPPSDKPSLAALDSIWVRAARWIAVPTQ
jgi:hypothetical protein